jgi:hypothetical protein
MGLQNQPLDSKLKKGLFGIQYVLAKKLPPNSLAENELH